MKKLFLVLAAALFFAACGDKKDPKIERSQLVGTWKATQAYGWEMYGGQREEYQNSFPVDAENLYWVLESDGKGMVAWWDVEDDVPWDFDNFTWTFAGNTLRLADEYGDATDYRVEKVNSTTLVISESHKEPAENYESYDRVSFVLYPGPLVSNR